MSTPAQDLYQAIILDHYKHPRHQHKMEHAEITSHNSNPLCGDSLTLYLNHRHDGTIEASFEGRGCAISLASASIMLDAINGHSQDESLSIIEQFKKMMRGEMAGDEENEITALSGIRKFPVRLKCAHLAWDTLYEALSPAR